MAKRMSSTDLSLSESLADCSEFAQLLFLYMIPHQDDWGRLVGNPGRVKAKVMPLCRRPAATFEKAIIELAEHSLICWYGDDGERYIAFKPESCEEYQQGIHKTAVERGRKSKFPPPADPRFRWAEDDSQGLSPIIADGQASRTRAEPNLTKPNLTKPNPPLNSPPTKGGNAEKNPISAEERDKIVSTYRKGYQALTDKEPIVQKADVMALIGLMKKAPPEEIAETISFAVSGAYFTFNNKPCDLKGLVAQYNTIQGVMGRLNKGNPRYPDPRKFSQQQARDYLNSLVKDGSLKAYSNEFIEQLCKQAGVKRPADLAEQWGK
jgi:hypothetical protein